MGRLFWKFFIIFWLAQFVASTGVGVMVWLEHRSNGEQLRPFAPPPPPPPSGAHGPAVPPGGGEMPPPPPRRIAPPLLPILAGSLVSLAFAALLAWYFARPIRTLRSAFSAVADGKLETRIGGAMGKRNDELADLGHDFDHMADRLDKLIETQRRLLHDVSHELRSPLARLQAAADLMVQQPERGAEFVDRIQRDTARMDGLVGELLALARLDAGMAGRLDEDVDLYEIVADIADAAGFEAQLKHCTIACHLADTLIVRGNHELLHRAIENVVRNALRHSPSGGVVRIAAGATGNRLRVSISDQGAGVPEDELEKIFRPFYRANDQTAGDGYGLGLAIAKKVIAAVNGQIRAKNGESGGLVVEIDETDGEGHGAEPIETVDETKRMADLVDGLLEGPSSRDGQLWRQTVELRPKTCE